MSAYGRTIRKIIGRGGRGVGRRSTKKIFAQGNKGILNEKKFMQAG